MPRPSAATIVLGVLCLGALSIATNIATSTHQEARIELGMTVTVDAPHPWMSWWPARTVPPETSGAPGHNDG